MKTQILKWGNSLALRIPKAVATEMRLVESSQVEMKLEKGRITLRPVKRKTPTLEELVARIDPGNCHDEVTTGTPQGREAW